MIAYIACMNVSKRLIQLANKYLLFAGREVRIGKNCGRADSSPVVFMHEIQRRERLDPRKERKVRPSSALPSRALP